MIDKINMFYQSNLLFEKHMLKKARLEDYLETIFKLETIGQKPSVTAVSKELDLTKGTVVSAIKKMMQGGHVIHEPYGSIKLTNSGRQIAWTTLCKHKALTSFFYKILGVDLEKSSEMACLIEHHLTKTAENRIYSLIAFFDKANQSNDPWIKELSNEIQVTKTHSMPLVMHSDDLKAEINHISAQGDIKKKLADLGITQGDPIVYIKSKSTDNSFFIKHKKRELFLPFTEAVTIWV